MLDKTSNVLYLGPHSSESSLELGIRNGRKQNLCTESANETSGSFSDFEKLQLQVAMLSNILTHLLAQITQISGPNAIDALVLDSNKDAHLQQLKMASDFCRQTAYVRENQSF